MATADMKLGVNNHVNQGTKKSSLKLMAGGPSKVNPPNSHPFKPQCTNRQPKPRGLPQNNQQHHQQHPHNQRHQPHQHHQRNQQQLNLLTRIM